MATISPPRQRYKTLSWHSLCLAMPLSFAALAGEEAAKPPVFSVEQTLVSHQDPVQINPKLSLSQLVEQTLAKYPDGHWLDALEEEAKAISRRSESWVAGAPQAGLRYQEASSGTLHYIDAQVQVPLWNIGQRDAEATVGAKAEESAQAQTVATKLRIAGLVRAALWDMSLQKIRYEQAQAEITIFSQLLAKIQRRVELGDLPRADELLAQTELLQKRALLTMAEAELMHARKRYASLTQTTQIPAVFGEKLVALREIQASHPALQAVNSQIERKEAELEALKRVGSGQSNVAVGINSDSFTSDPRSNKTESFNIGVNVPFGGSAHIQPHIAALNVELNRLIAERELLYRNLEQLHHEAEHNLEVNRVALGIANELKQVAEQHLGMSNTAFSVGEIDLIDLLKIQSRTQQAILNAKERALMLERDQAFYNQAVGVMP
ncbi:TolC family protein [Methylovulum psychrotolerans]|uniref:TolC family protein n=1 Tax=Methylovulum psychrotolerans TaxID=1704499 RepID=A0A2S5CHT0_9GAMM|nr:TolC family protein [Methylovulum psychrotolerans]POZ50373.1 TolC family protein [Methylovulum psychrotolerans]